MSELQTFFWRVGTPAYQEKLENAAAIIARMERIFMVGIGNSGSIASYGARYFSNLGKFALCVSDPFYPSMLAQFCDLTLPYYTNHAPQQSRKLRLFVTNPGGLSSGVPGTACAQPPE